MYVTKIARVNILFEREENIDQNGNTCGPIMSMMEGFAETAEWLYVLYSSLPPVVGTRSRLQTRFPYIDDSERRHPSKGPHQPHH